MQADASAATRRIGSVIGGRWRLDRLLGVGASAAVFAAADATGQRAAVKVLNLEAGANEDARARFDREADLAARIQHPAIVRVLERNTRDPVAPYLAMELLEGETLGERLSRVGTVPIPELLELADQLLDGLAAAHATGVVHRDLKPGNVFLAEDGRARILDFGVARLLEPGSGPGTRAGLAIGTAAYMSPEQAMGKTAQIDARTDLFALGAILFRVVTGRRIHEAATVGELLAAMATRPAPALASVCPTAPSAVGALIDVALGFDPNSRYPDARTMQRDVRAARDGRSPPYATELLARADQATVAPGLVSVRNGVPSRALGAERVPVSSGTPAASASPAPEDAEADELVGRTVAGRYRIERLLGTGGMGAVYQAEHIHMRKTVALKVLHREMTAVPEVVARFEREAIAASRVEHPNVVAATDFGKLEDGSFYLALEFVEGRSLRAVLDAEGALAPHRAAHIAQQIACALGEAHAQGIVHRDLKPDNVMLVERPENAEHVKVLDFGIAKISAEDLEGQPALTQFGAVFGTPEYMSPEQAMGGAVDHRADNYALGILLYEMLSGRTPFGDDDLMVVLTRQMTAIPAPLPSSVPPALAQLVAQLLQKRAAERPNDANAVAAALAPFAAAVSTGAAGVVSGSRVELAFTPTVARLPAPAGGDALAVLMDQVGERLRPVQAALVREVTLGGRRVAVWMLALFGGLLAIGFLVALTWLARPGSSTAGGRPGRASGVDAEREPSAQGPKGVGPSSVAQIQARPEAERSAVDWRTLALDHAAREDHGSALAAATRAVAGDPSLAEDRALLTLVRRAADSDEDGAVAVALAARMGSGGADVLFDVWQSSRDAAESPPTATLAESLLGRDDVRAKASPALRLALDLRPGKTCSDYKKLMPTATAHADQRAAPYLAKLTKVEFCRGGRFSFRNVDCWACLRTDESLSEALARAERTPAPSFNGAAP